MGWSSQLGPEDWPTAGLRHVALLRNSNVDKVVSETEVPVRLLNYTDVYYGAKLTSSNGWMEGSASPAEVSAFALRRGDVVLTKDSELASDIGVPALVAGDVAAVCGYHLTIARPGETLSGAFLYWVMEGGPARAHFTTAARGVTRFGLTLDGIGSLQVPLPDYRTQALIAEFLDWETERIDAVVAAKRRMIDLLDEERTALITHTVTKGLDPTVPMKDSGIPWLGDIPAHWEAVPNRYVLSHVRRLVGIHSDSYVLLSLTRRGVVPRDTESGKGKYPASFDTYQAVEPGEFVFCLFDVDETPRTVGLSQLHGMVTGAYDIFQVWRVVYPTTSSICTCRSISTSVSVPSIAAFERRSRWRASCQ